MPESERPKCGTDAAPQSVHIVAGCKSISLRLIIKSSAFEPRIITEGVAGKDACK